MSEYQKRYIELKKEFEQTDGAPESICALYAFKEELEQTEDMEAKNILVYVYDLLDFKKDAYELLLKIGDRSDKKVLKRLGVSNIKFWISNTIFTLLLVFISSMIILIVWKLLNVIPY